MLHGPNLSPVAFDRSSHGIAWHLPLREVDSQVLGHSLT